ncbi:hypothetical protein [Streptomyces sp. NPDC091416]|uniref:hypothetical protein n=1 Tax=Streptomyces sp. NPDC091416 TaxID=3366003 RepID=UPI00382ABE15
MTSSSTTTNSSTQHTDSDDSRTRRGRGRGFIRQSLEAGTHPATGRPLAACGGCVHLRVKRLGDQSEHLKCGLLIGVGRRNGGPDLYKETPACVAFEEAPGVQTDAGARAA